MRWFLTTLAAAALLALASGALHADPITQIVVFGDSLSDTGNAFAKLGVPPAPYYQGRFSNGPVWVERLAQDFGVAAPTPSEKGGTDYAYGYATTGDGLSPKGTLNVGAQVSAYLGTSKPNAGQLFVVWAGANDFFGGQFNPLVPVTNIGSSIAALAAAGAKQFVVPNYPDLGATPYGQSLDAAHRQGLTALTKAYNGILSSEIGYLQSTLGVKITQLDTYSLFQKIQGSPSAYGFTNVTTAATTDGVVPPTGYLFWDTVHPTAAGHQLIGDAAFNAITGAPEPTSLALLSIGAVGVAVGGWRRRQLARAA